MRKTITFKLLCFLCLLGLGFTSCDITQNLKYDEVSIRFKNISETDIENISTLGLNIETLKAGEVTEYFTVEEAMVDDDGQPLFIINSYIEGNYCYNETSYTDPLFCGIAPGGCIPPDDYSGGEMLKNGKYTVSIDWSGEFVAEGRTNFVYLITELKKD